MTPIFSPWVWLWTKVADFYDYLCWEGRWIIPADTRKRMVINCKCECGVVQLVGGVLNLNGTLHQYRECAAGCGRVVNSQQHRVGDWECTS